MISHKSDIWSGSVTMMNVLVGKDTNSVSHAQVWKTCLNYFYTPVLQTLNFLKTASNTIRSVSRGMDSCVGTLGFITEKVCLCNVSCPMVEKCYVCVYTV